MRKLLYNKTVIVTGASGGLGLATVKTLIQKYNCTVIGIARSEDKMKSAISSLGEFADSFSYKIFDVTNRDKWAEFGAELEQSGTAADVIINNAGMMLPFSKAELYPDGDIDEIISVNFRAYVTAFRTMLPIISKSGSPVIVNICSAGGLCAVAGQSLYCATKYAVRAFTDTVRAEHRDITVCGVYPGFIKSDIMRRQQMNERESSLVAHAMMRPDKAASIILRRVNRGRKSIVLGVDGHMLSAAGRLAPTLTPRIAAYIMKKSGLELFKNV